MALINATIARPDAALSFGEVTPSATSTNGPNVLHISTQDVNGLTFELHLKGYAGTGNVSAKLQQGDDATTFTDVSGVATDNLTADGVAKVQIKGVTKKYLRAVIAGASTVTAGTAEAEINVGV